MTEEITPQDSRPATYEHIHLVQTFLCACIHDLVERQRIHDRPKLFSPEREAYDGLEERLRQQEYGSEGYRAVLREIKPAIHHHYANTHHHPEHWVNGIKDMSLLDLLEMICDWFAASMRPPGNDIRSSMDHNQERFGFSDELKAILHNTINALEDMT